MPRELLASYEDTIWFQIPLKRDHLGDPVYSKDKNKVVLVL
jgi:hypothetical protein